MMFPAYQLLRRLFWRLPVPSEWKERLVGRLRRLLRGPAPNPKQGDAGLRHDLDVYRAYTEQILAIPERNSKDFVPLASESFTARFDDPKILAYYLPQFHPTKENDQWWGLGVTEWNNVSRAVPQFLGHYQPRLPGELGYYDLRLSENMARQIELARAHGVFGFAFYFYTFGDVRLLDRPLDAFVANPRLDFPFCLCWANESWTRRFDGTCGEILMEQPESAESYRAFIQTALPYLRDQRYVRVDGRPVVIIYRPSFVTDCERMLDHWRRVGRAEGVGEPYLIGVREHTWDVDLLQHGFDAQSEFHPGTLFRHCVDITNKQTFARQDFGGMVLDYADIVLSRKFELTSGRKLHRAVMPMWDNTPRRNNMGMIFHGSTPQLYGRWLTDVLRETRRKVAASELDDSFVFLNAWNEWGEGAYLEPDARFGYAYLDATRRAIVNSRYDTDSGAEEVDSATASA